LTPHINENIRECLHNCKPRRLSETFKAQTATGEILYFSKQKAEEQSQGKQAHVIPATLLNFLAFRNSFVEQHVVHVAEIQTPGIIVFSGRRVILIDGTHRAVSALRTRHEFTAYCLDETEVSGGTICLIRGYFDGPFWRNLHTSFTALFSFIGVVPKTNLPFWVRVYFALGRGGRGGCGPSDPFGPSKSPS
jgi:hypothetical protein